MLYFPSLGHRSFLDFRLQHILMKIRAQMMMIAAVMTEANICRPLLSNILPMTLVAVTCKTPIEHTVKVVW